MEISPILQSKLLLYTILWGFVAGFIWDVIRALKSFIKGKRAVYLLTEGITDFLFIVTLCIGVIVLGYYFNSGDVRTFEILGTFIGIFFYRKILSRIVFKILKHVFYFNIRAVLWLTSPFVKMFKYLVNFLKKGIQFILKTLAKSIVLVYNVYSKKRVIKKAKSAFLMDIKR